MLYVLRIYYARRSRCGNQLLRSASPPHPELPSPHLRSQRALSQSGAVTAPAAVTVPSPSRGSSSRWHTPRPERRAPPSSAAVAGAWLTWTEESSQEVGSTRHNKS